MSARTAKHEFTEGQRAEIFARDRALCSYSGRTLWLPDYGATPYAIDWVDHVVPVARGGKPTLANGVCSSHLYNYVKRAGAGGITLFRAGFPTADFFTFYHRIPEETAEHLRRFSSLHPSDWYFNRALFHVLLGAASKGQKRQDGSAFKRDPDYRANAALRYLGKWRKYADGIASQHSRGLLPRRQSTDQKLLLSATQMETAPQIKRLIRALSPHVNENFDALQILSTITTRSASREFLRAVVSSPFVAARIKLTIRQNIAALTFPDDA